MEKKLNADHLVKKLKGVSNTQDSIPMLSLWIIRNKSHHKLITEQWFQVLKQSKHSHRLTLLYLCNDVIQNCTRKKAPVFKESFCDVLPEAITLLRDSSIRTNVQRVIKIWSKRSVLDTDFTDQLLAALVTNKPPERLRNKLLVEYKTSHLIEEIKRFKALEDEIDADHNCLRSLRVDVSSTDAIRKLKDKVGGEKFSKDFEESASQVESFLQRYEKFVEQRKQLLELLERGSVYYHAQYHEAKIVVNAYKNFEGRVNKMKRGLDKVALKLSSTKDFEVDVPSPKNDSPVVQEDMEMSDDDKTLGSKPSKIVAVDTSKLKSKRETTLTQANNSTPLPRATESVLKLIASGLESIKANPDSAEESLKRVVSGLVNRPGMRGASSTGTAKSSDTPLGTLTITRSIEQGSEGEQRVPTPGSVSPPSPTGSPELNISSPPRHQSLDSRLADIFNDATPGDAEKGDSDTESDTAEQSRDVRNASPAVEEPASQTETLPGLGGLDEIQKNIPGLSEVSPPQDFYGTSTASSERHAESGKGGIALTRSGSASETSNSHAIPVIGGSLRAPSASMEGPGTPTLDEEPYSRKPDDTTGTAYPATATSFLSPPRFSGDALSFLTKFMGQATKTELTTMKPATASLCSAVARDKDCPAWPQTEAPTTTPKWPASATASDTSSSSVSQVWQLPAPALPPLPWSLLNASGRSTVSLSQQPFPLGTKGTHDKEPVIEPDSSKLTLRIPVEPPVAKKAKWESEDISRKDTDYRQLTPEHPREKLEQVGCTSPNHAQAVTAARRNSNLITLSDMAPEPRNNGDSTSSGIDEPMAHFKDLLRRKSDEFAASRSYYPEPRKPENMPNLPEPRQALKPVLSGRNFEGDLDASRSAVSVGRGDTSPDIPALQPVPTNAFRRMGGPQPQGARNGLADPARMPSHFFPKHDYPPRQMAPPVSPVRPEAVPVVRPEPAAIGPPQEFGRFPPPGRPRLSSPGAFSGNFRAGPLGMQQYGPRSTEAFRPSFPPPRSPAPSSVHRPELTEDQWLEHELNILEEDRRRDAVLVDSVFGPRRRSIGGRREWQPDRVPHRSPRPRMHRPPRPPRFVNPRRGGGMRFR